MAIEVTHSDAAVARGVRIGGFVARSGDGRHASIEYDDYVSRWIVRVATAGDADLIAAALDRCVSVADDRGITLVPGCDEMDRLLGRADRRHVADVLPDRAEQRKTIDVPPPLAAFCARVARRLRALAAEPAAHKEDARRLVRTSQAEAILSLGGEDAQVEWFPNGKRGTPGWDQLVAWMFTLDRAQLERVGARELTKLDIDEVVVSGDEAVRLRDVEALLDAWVADGTMVLTGDPEGPPRTRAVKRLARTHLRWFEDAWSIADVPGRKAAAATLAATLMESPEIDDLYADDLELYRCLVEGLWRRADEPEA